MMLLANLLLPYGLRFIAHFVRLKREQPSAIHKVSVIMPVYNEEANIVKRLANIKDALAGVACETEVLIGSDGSRDKTVELAEEFILGHRLVGWHVHSFPNEGKGQTINKLVLLAAGDLIISTDADVAMEPSAIELIVKIFEEDGRIGCLSSIPTFTHEKKSVQSFYWKSDLAIREAESRLGKLIVVTGWLYAFRKALFTQIPPDAMADDLWVPLTVLLKGSRCVQDKRLKAFSEATNETTEIKRRKRVISGGVDIVRRLQPQLRKKPGLYSIVYFHKINRWLLPLWCLGVFLGTIMLQPYLILVYALGTVALVFFLTPRRFAHLVISVMTPAVSFLSMPGKKDLSKWEHTRISE